MKACRIRIRVDHQDGTGMDVEYIVPTDVADFLTTSLIGWEEEWVTDFKSHEEFLKNIEKLKAQGK